MTINHCYWRYDCKHHYTRQIEKEALKSHSQKQGKASIAGNVAASQNKANLSLLASSTKSSPFKLSSSPASKKKSNSPWVDLSSKLASNRKLTSDEYKKNLENNLCLYCGAGNYKLDFYPKKQTTVTPKGCSASTNADSLAAASEKSLEKQRVTLRALHKLRTVLNFSIQQEFYLTQCIYLLFLILIHYLYPLLLS